MLALPFSCSVPFAWGSWLHRQEHGSAYLALSRGEGAEEVTVVANLTAAEQALALPFEGSRREFFTGKEYTGGTRTVLPAWQWLVFAQDRR